MKLKHWICLFTLSAICGCTDEASHPEPVPCEETGTCPPTCDSDCTVDTFVCEGNQLKKCTSDADGCTSWELVETCSKEQTCNSKQGKCLGDCKDACTAGDKKCADGGIATCETVNSGCTVWGNPVDCGENKRCDAETQKCVDGCVDECLSGEMKCTNGGMKTCGQYDNDACTEWSASEPCGTGKKCSDDEKSCVNACGDACKPGEMKCDGETLKQCKLDDDACPTWSTIETCSEGTVCNATRGSCSEPCGDNCNPGTYTCDEATLKVCEIDDDECPSWNVAKTCDEGTQCDAAAGQCTEACGEKCNAGVYKCDGSALKQCKTNDNGCTSWEVITTCNTNQTCSSEQGKCLTNCTNACTPGEVKCIADNGQSKLTKCTTDANGCGVWGTPVQSTECNPFSIVLIPDSQYYTRQKGGCYSMPICDENTCTSVPKCNDNNKYYCCDSSKEEQCKTVLIDQMVALKNKKDAWNIRYVIHLGDLTQKNIEKDYSGNNQWQLASNGQKVLDAADIPNIVSTGNHDYKKAKWNTSSGKCESDEYFSSHTNSFFKNYFNASRYSGKSWAPTFFKNSSESMYGTFQVANHKFLVVALEFAPRKETLCEADKIISAHPDHHVIISTHSLMNKSGKTDITYNDTLFGADGTEMVNELAKRHENVFLVVGGHFCGSFYRETKRGYNGNLIREMLVDYQDESPMGKCADNDISLNNAGNGWVRRIEIDPVSGKMTASTESMLINPKTNKPYAQMYCSEYYPTNPKETIEVYNENKELIGYSGHAPVMTKLDFSKTPSDNYKVNSYAFTARQIGTGKRHQMNGAIAMNRADNPNGVFVTVWEDDDEEHKFNDGNDKNNNINYDIRARISCTGGCNKSGFFYVNTNYAGNQKEPDVAMDANGNFVVVWADDSDGNTTYEILMRRFDKTGKALSDVTKVNTVADGQQVKPKIAMADDGKFVVVWQDSSAGYDQVFMRGFNANGSERFAQKVAAGGSTGTYRNPDIAMSSTGDFVIAWEDDSDGNKSIQLYARLFTSDGTLITIGNSDHVVVNKEKDRDQLKPAVAMNSKGDYAIAWLDERTTKGKFITYVRGFKAGTMTEFIAEKALPPAGYQSDNPDIVMDDQGNLVVTWEIEGGYFPSRSIGKKEYCDVQEHNCNYCKYANTQTGGCNDIVRMNYKNGTWDKTVSIVNKNRFSGHTNPAIAIDKASRYVILWNDDSDGNNAYDIYMRGYNGI